MKRHIGVIAVILSVAQAAFGFSIKPGAQVVRVEAGKTMKVDFEIENDQKEPLKITPRVKDSFVLPENKGMNASSWLEPLFKEVTVPAQGSKKVQFTVKAPAKATGELAALVSFIPEVKEPEKPVEVKGGIQTRIVTLITVSLYVRIKGTEKGEADLGAIQVNNKPAAGATSAKIEVSVVVKNSGNVHQRPGGQFEIFKKDESKPMSTLEFKSGWPVMPKSEYAYLAFQDGSLAPGDYEIHAKLSFGPDTTIEKKASFTITPAGATTNIVEIH